MVLKACDRCHTRKEKCAFAGSNQRCTRCCSLAIACSTSRRGRRIGRLPVVKAFPYGEAHIWSVDSTQLPNLQRSVSRSGDSHSILGPLSRRSSSTLPASDLALSDEFASSAEAVWSPDRNDAIALGPGKLLASPTTLKTASDALRTFLDREQFSALHMPFLIGPSFVPMSQKVTSTLLYQSAPVLADAYLAYTALMTRYQRTPIMRQVEPDIAKAAKGLQHLRDINIKKDTDAVCALSLGQTMYAFHVLAASDAFKAHSVVQNALIRAKSWVPRLIHSPITQMFIITPVLIDTVECLVRREVPIIRLPSTDHVIIDRYAGVCATLLPLLYDLCQCSHNMKSGVLDIRGFHDRLAGIQQTITEWKPPTPPQLFIEHGPHERLLIITQANVYRLAALLAIHRLRYPLGVQDEIARELANGIFSHILSFAQSAAKEVTAFPMIFPLTMAMIEDEGKDEDLGNKLPLFASQSMGAIRLVGSIKQIRASREAGYDGIWFNLVGTHLRMAMPP